ncbi:hypothetical protein AVEN_189215-1 [Araneus ventricosus]|uniref:Uncharacterized protein n=1 Tax=Araneus ventricosus TaxID=182803 RepID=A0A4Y2P2V4_ARAVE|nr:hypothetical protein AVEN_189215-1 [Araneus ventricosus]
MENDDEEDDTDTSQSLFDPLLTSIRVAPVGPRRASVKCCVLRRGTILYLSLTQRVFNYKDLTKFDPTLLHFPPYSKPAALCGETTAPAPSGRPPTPLPSSISLVPTGNFFEAFLPQMMVSALDSMQTFNS